jgi:hypothetical protein
MAIRISSNNRVCLSRSDVATAETAATQQQQQQQQPTDNTVHPHIYPGQKERE